MTTFRQELISCDLSGLIGEASKSNIPRIRAKINDWCYKDDDWKNATLNERDYERAPRFDYFLNTTMMPIDDALSRATYGGSTSSALACGVTKSGVLPSLRLEGKFSGGTRLPGMTADSHLESQASPEADCPRAAGY